MKKILGLAAGILLSAMTFAQTTVTFNDAGANYDAASTTVFHFTFDASYAEADLNSQASYYADYFTTSIEASGTGHTVTFTLVEDTDMARRVISRYFISLDVPSVKADGKDYTVDEFFPAFIMRE